MIPSQPLWQAAEDAFLLAFCDEITRYNWGSLYIWKGHLDWPKFSFVRILDPQVDRVDLEQAILKLKGSSLQSNEEAYIRVPRDILLPPQLLKRFRKDPDSIVSLVYNPIECADSASSRGDLTFRECLTDNDLRLWWEVNSDARQRANPFSSALWPIIQKKANSTRYFLLLKDQVAITCGAIDPFPGGFNSWGLGTREAFQRQGFSREYMRHVSNVFGNRIHSQVDFDEPRHKRLLKCLSTVTLAIEDLYVL